MRLEDKGDDEILVVGGEDHVVGINPTDYKDAYGLLEQWARARWPAAQEVVYRWTGQVGNYFWFCNSSFSLCHHITCNSMCLKKT